MKKVKSLEDLRKMRESLKSGVSLREKGNSSEKMIQVKVSMATCGIASGAKEIMNHIITELDQRKIDAIVTQTGCMGYCYAEPTIEVLVPGKDPVVFGEVDAKRANEIISKYIQLGELVDGVIPVNYETIEENKNE